MATRNVPKGETPQKNAPILRGVASASTPWWHQPTAEARDAVSLLLNQACRLDLFEEDSDSNYALRLLGMAAVVVDDDMLPAAVLNAEDPQNTVADACFNCIALLRATLVHPDGSFDIRRRTWVLQALSILDVLTDLHMNGAQGPDYVLTLRNTIAHRLAQEPAPVAQSAPQNLAPASAPSTGIVSADTELVDGGNTALGIVSHATWDIEPLSDALVDLAGEMGGSEAGLVRCYALRIKHLNSIVMSYLTEDSITIDDANREVFGQPFNAQEEVSA